MKSRTPSLPLLLILSVWGVRVPVGAVDYQREVRPILSDHCFKCHGPDESTREADLRLDEPATAKEASAIIPHHPEKSLLMERILTHDQDDLMPPPSANKPLSEAQKGILRQWIEEGAVYTRHWAYIQPKEATLPKVPNFSGNTQRNAIDSFIHAKVAQQGLPLSPQADPATLLRRVSLDLIGLPPTPQEAAAFKQAWLKDADAAYEQLVTRLLESPHYGERWARRWLDLARYADTNGYEKDRPRSIWPYRDWVIQALNEDMPFDRFTVEQLAGDMLPQATLPQRIATGFHRNTMLNEEGGIDPLEFRYHAMVDRVATTGTTWLGLTTGCAQCHTHKFDPILHTEYFGLMAFLNNADEPEQDIVQLGAERDQTQRDEQAARLLASLPEQWPTPKETPLPPDQRRQAAEAAFQSWLSKEQARNVAWQTQQPTRWESNLPILTPQPDGSVFVSGDITKSDTYRLTFPKIPKGTTAVRLEVLPDERLPAHGPGLCYYEGPKGDFFLGELEVLTDGKPLPLRTAKESYSKNHFGKTPATALLAMDGDLQTGWSCAGRCGERHEAVFILKEPLAAETTLEVKMQFGRHYACSLGRFRISTTVTTDPAARDLNDTAATLLNQPTSQLTQPQRQVLFEHFLLQTPELEKAAKAILAVRKPTEHLTTLVMRERPANEPRETFRHHRGEYSQPKEKIEPHTPAFLHTFPEGLPRNRLGFARWLTSSDNPITARVVMNRTWAGFFGRGIVKTIQDFGYQGDYPTHPELLDWLALEFARSGWSMKHMHRLMVMSETYRQSSMASPEARQKDPENRWLSHAPRLRLDAELIRDSVLKASDLLNPKIGGPSVFPPQPEGATEAAYGKSDWTPSTGSDRYRRGLYTHMKRTAPFAMFSTFDGPSGEACLANRETSDTPLQALTLLNDISIQEASQALGKKIAQTSGTETERIHQLFQRILCRPPTEDETASLLTFIQTQTQAKPAPSDPSLPWTLAVRALFNLDEFVTRG